MKPASVLGAALAALLFASCATSPAVPDATPGELSLSLKEASARDLPTVAGGLHTPYAPPDFLITKCDQDFVVLAIELESATGGNAIRLLEAGSEDGKLTLYSREGLVEWWKARSYYDTYRTSWVRCLERTYAPDEDFRAKRGTSTYFAVLMGKKPVEKPLVVRARFIVDGEERELACEVE